MEGEFGNLSTARLGHQADTRNPIGQRRAVSTLICWAMVITVGAGAAPSYGASSMVIQGSVVEAQANIVDNEIDKTSLAGVKKKGWGTPQPPMDCLVEQGR
jgi:hypothetical protein